MENNFSTDKQLVSSIRNTEWIDLSPGHKTLRTSIEEQINSACVLKIDTSPIMVKGAFGIGKTATLHYMFHYAWTKLMTPTFFLNLDDLINEVKKHLVKNNLDKLPNKDVSKVIESLLSSQIKILENSNSDDIVGNQVYFPSFDQGSLTDYLSKFERARLHAAINGEYQDKELPLFDFEKIKEAINSENRSLILIDEFESKYQELKGLIESSGGGMLRHFFDDVASISSTNYYCIIGNGPASGYELNQDLKDKSDSNAAEQRRLFVKQLQMPTVASLSKTFLKDYPKEHINFIWWLSRSRPGQIKKLKDQNGLQPLNELKEHNYIQFLRENKVLNEPLDDVGESNVTFLKTNLFEGLSINQKDLIKELLINLGPFELEIKENKLKEELAENKELFYASTQKTKVSDIINVLQEDILKIKGETIKYSQVNFDSLHIYIDLILSSISNQNNELVFGVINKDVDEYLSKNFLTPLFSILYDFITIYEDEHDKKTKILLDFILDLINKSENKDVDIVFPSSFDLFEEGSVKLKREDKVFIQLNLNTIRETIEQPIGSPKLPYKAEPLKIKMSDVDTIENIFIWNKNEFEEIIIIPNYSNNELIESYIEILKKYFNINWTDKKKYFNNGQLISTIIYFDENDHINNFKEWLFFTDGEEKLPYKLKRLDVKHIDSYHIQNTQRISDFILSLAKIATIGLFNNEIDIKDVREYSDNEYDYIIRINKIVDVILDSSWTESKQTRRTIEYYKDLLLIGDNSVLMSLIKTAKNNFETQISEIFPIVDQVKNSLIKVSIEDKIFEEAHSTQTKNLFNLLLSEINVDEVSTLKAILKATREFKYRPSLDNKNHEVSLMDLFFSFERNNNITDCIDDYKNSKLEKNLSRFAKLVTNYIKVDSLIDLTKLIYNDKTLISSYSKSLNFYDSNIPFLNGFYFLSLSQKLVYADEVVEIKQELVNIQEEFNELESDLSDKLYDLKKLTNTENELNYSTELRSYNTSLIKPLLDILDNSSNISYLILTHIICKYLENTIKRANRFRIQINKIVEELEDKKTIIEAKQNEFDDIYNKSLIHKKLISKNKTKDFFYNEKYVKSFKFDNTFNLIFGDINKFKPSEKYYIEENEFEPFLSSLKRSYDKKSPEINIDIEEANKVYDDIEKVLKIEESIRTLISIEDND